MIKTGNLATFFKTGQDGANGLHTEFYLIMLP